MGQAQPASAVTLPGRPFALWPPNHCGQSAGSAAHLGGLAYEISASTASLKALDTGGCNDISPAPAGTFAAMPRLQVYFEPLGGWIECRYDEYLWRGSSAGAWLVTSRWEVFGCGSAPHRMWASSRITYAGVDQRDNRYTGAL